MRKTTRILVGCQSLDSKRAHLERKPRELPNCWVGVLVFCWLTYGN